MFITTHNFDSFGEFLSALLSEPSGTNQVVVQTVRNFLKEDNLRSLLEKVAAHQFMKGKGDLQSMVPQYAFHPSNPQQECMFAVLNNISLCCSHQLYSDT